MAKSEFGDPRLEDRFWQKVAVATNGCWIWLGAKTPGGYGIVRCKDSRKNCVAHRFSYMALIGKIPDRLDLDHLCRIRSCVNPVHLEPVTRRENHRRSPLWPFKKRNPICHRGHSYSIAKSGRQVCIPCIRERKRAKRVLSLSE